MKHFIISNMLFIGYALIILAISPNCNAFEQEDGVRHWADRLGRELWDLGRVITKSTEIKSRYKFLNAQIEEKDPKKLLAEIVDNIARMMDRKMDAIRCILNKAEEVAEATEFNNSNILEYTYYSSKCSTVEGEDSEHEGCIEEFEYENMKLNSDTHFYNIPVNTNYSSVHVPTNIYDRHDEAAVAIQWSATLDEVFKQNYKSDPALSWQYFGSSSGVMRHYPAMQWVNSGTDLFDCRIRTWFIEAATCTKDVVILLDNSGSMTGMRKHIAAFTVNSILDTFSNNDYINVLNYSTTVDYTVSCFKDQLIQATRENIGMFKYAVKFLEANDKSKLSEALTHALELLKKYRELRKCSENSTDCNQAIMLVTDGVPRNMSDILTKYNSLNNGTSIPVRIFTYLIGKEVTNVDEIMWMACVNRGYYTHIQSLEEVTGAVLKYIPVIARPLVLQQVEHPPSWTHAYADITYDDETDDQINEPYRLLTTVAVPAYDLKLNRNNESRTAELLGVAATDVPIDDIRKLTFPYKIGVNGYAFVVSNNGYVLWHPALRPMLGKILKENFNSVDFTEVEQMDTELPPRVLSETLLKLRSSLVNGEEGTLKNVKLKYHYDNMRRVTRTLYDYYYAPLENTPFTIGLAIPQKYGKFAVEVGDVIQKNKHTGIKITSFFEGSNWKIHPKWIYCKYHYLEGHEFDTPENELIHFLQQMYNRDFKWRPQYEAMSLKKHKYFDLFVEDLEKVECGRKVLGDDDYYCDQQLVQRLIFDAKNTLYAFNERWTFKNEREELLFKKYNATLRFVATMSGLTRWEYIFGEKENNTSSEFGDLHSRAIDEQWYKSAVFQHQYDKESFVYSVPFDANEDDDILVTGSYAIFPEDAGIEAPGSVVGFQFSHSHLEKQFFNITGNCPKCLPCGHDHSLDCYLIDSSGYVIVSHHRNDIGKFFGEVEGAVMETMLEKNIYERVVIFDYQAICFEDFDSSDTNCIGSPLKYVLWFAKLVMWIFVKTNIHQLWDPNLVLANSFLEQGQTTEIPLTMDNEHENENEEEEEEEEITYRSCDKKRDLFYLNQTKFIGGNVHAGKVKTKCARPFYVQKVAHSNMLLIAVESMHQQCYRKFSVEPQEIEYENYTFPCQKLNLNNLPRRRLAGCFNEHFLEHEITACGKSNQLGVTQFLFLMPTILILYYVPA